MKNKKNKQKLIDTDNSMLFARGKGGWGGSKGKAAKYMVMEDDLTLGGGYRIQCTDYIS